MLVTIYHGCHGKFSSKNVLVDNFEAIYQALIRFKTRIKE